MCLRMCKCYHVYRCTHIKANVHCLAMCVLNIKITHAVISVILTKKFMEQNKREKWNSRKLTIIYTVSSLACDARTARRVRYFIYYLLLRVYLFVF